MLRAMEPAAPPHPDRDAIAAAAGALRSTLAVARTLAEAGRRIDLSGLDREAAALCEAVLVLPPEEGRGLLPDLTAIVAEVAALAEALPRPG
jgi:hypothetical protein